MSELPTAGLPVATVTVVRVGTAVWTLALLVTLLVPALRTGERHWWPWACVTGIVLGVVGLVMLRRGRGNFAGAR